jgi:pilus assembly protein CpaB
MNRNTRMLVVLAVALIAAAGASYSVYLTARTGSEGPVQVAFEPAVVAARPLPLGTLLTRDDVKLVQWPAEARVEGSFTSIEQVANRGLLQAVAENDLLTAAKVAEPGAGSGLPPTIPPGMRAISVKVDEVVSVAGFVVPGTRVDVLVSIGQGQGESLTRVVVSNVQVLTAGTRFDEQARQEGKPIPTTVVTLLVTPENAERIALASGEGRIMLTLRNPLDLEPTETQGVRRGSLFGAAPPAPEPRREPSRRAERPATPAVVPAEAPPRPYTVETIRAAKRAEEPVR